jgi:hypothetical protein
MKRYPIDLFMQPRIVNSLKQAYKNVLKKI